MKQKISHIIFSCFLIANLLFSQVAINLFHTDHAGKSQTELKNGKLESKALIKHCKVCALDIVFNLLFQSSIQLNVPVSSPFYTLFEKADLKLLDTSRSQDRAPPVSHI